MDGNIQGCPTPTVSHVLAVLTVKEWRRPSKLMFLRGKLRCRREARLIRGCIRIVAEWDLGPQAPSSLHSQRPPLAYKATGEKASLALGRRSAAPGHAVRGTGLQKEPCAGHQLHSCTRQPVWIYAGDCALAHVRTHIGASPWAACSSLSSDSQRGHELVKGERLPG